MDDLVLRYQIIGDVVIVTYAPKAAGDPMPEGGLYALVEHGHRKVVLNFAGVGFLMSSRLGQIITLKSRLKPVGGYLCVCHLEPTLREVFEITRLDSLIRVHDTLDDAVASFA